MPRDKKKTYLIRDPSWASITHPKSMCFMAASPIMMPKFVVVNA